MHRIALLAIVGMLTISAPLRADDTFRAGAAKRDVTPTEPVPMWGYGARHDGPSEGALDPLEAAALVLAVGDQKLAIVGLDLGRSPSERSLQNIRRRIADEAGITHSFIAGSHTHHGPVLELSDEDGKGRGRFDAALRYYEQLENAIVEAILEADRSLQPATLAAGSVELEGFNRNRHTKQPIKPVDRQLAILRLDNLQGQPIALLANFAAHPTSLPSGDMRFSADYVGAMKRTIEREFGGIAVFMQGASGDLATDRSGRGDYAAFGEALGREAVRLAKSLEPTAPDRPTLEVREERFRFESRSDLTKPLVRAIYSYAFFPELVANFADEYSDGIRPRLTVAVLNGEIGLVGGSGEFFCNHAIRLRERARVQPLFFFGYANGYHQYFPTIEATAEGGYGADNQVAPVEVGAGEQLMNTALIWLYELQHKTKALR
jgi:neutral ceramidase